MCEATVAGASANRRNPIAMNKFDGIYKSVDLASIFANWHPYDQNVKKEAQKYKYVVFFGFGVTFFRMLDIWRLNIGKKIDYCCDNNSEKWGKSFDGIECISYEKLHEIKDETVVFITMGDFVPVYDQLHSAGFPAIHIIYKYDVEAAPYIRLSSCQQLTDAAGAARNLLSDSTSIIIIDSVISRSSGANLDILAMPNIYEKNQYFPDELIKLSGDESYIDVGAYDGETINQFLLKCNKEFEKIYAFELDRNIFLKLEKNLENFLRRNDISLFNIGAWDNREVITYRSGNFNSAIGEGAESGSVAPLDDLLKDVRVTYIKMDIEGAEIRALLGAKKIITAQKPKLAICVYHKISHLWEVPLLIHDMLPDHDIFLRHHSPLEYETVCYALPKSDSLIK